MPGSELFAVGWDLDSTLCSTVHRRWLVPEIRAGRATWEQYSDLCSDDAPVPGALQLAVMLHKAGHPQYAISGRSECSRERTLGWLMRHYVPMDHLILRADGDDTENGLWKAIQLNELQERGVLFGPYLEDWAPAARIITEKTGIPVLGVNPLDEGAILVTQEMLAERLAAHKAYAAARWTPPKQLAADLFAALGGAY